MFGLFSNVKFLVMGSAGLAVIGVVTTLWIMNGMLRSERDVAIANTATAVLAVATQQDTITGLVGANEEWSETVTNLQQTMEDLAEVQYDARAQQRRIQDAFATTDFEARARLDPRDVERRINRGTSHVFRLFECTTSRSGDACTGDNPPE